MVQAELVTDDGRNLETVKGHWHDVIRMAAEQTHWGALTASGVVRHWCV